MKNNLLYLKSYNISALTDMLDYTYIKWLRLDILLLISLLRLIGAIDTLNFVITVL
jgi:type IV secretory pathway VirB6-like protein